MNANEKIDRLIDITARAESGGDYSKWTPDDNGHGPSFGLIQYNATRGSLGKLIMMMREAKPEWFRLLFGSAPWTAEQWAAHVANAPNICRDLLQLSGQVPIWQKCQRDLARTEYFDPAAKLCAKFGLISERAHAMALDVSIQYGVGGLSEKLYTCRNEPTERLKLEHLALLADTHTYDTNRRHTLLQSRELSDDPMFPNPISTTPTETRPTLRRGDRREEVQQLQTLLNRAGYMTDGQTSRPSRSFGDATHRAVNAFQAAHGITVDGVVGPLTWAALDQAAKERGGKV